MSGRFRAAGWLDGWMAGWLGGYGGYWGPILLVVVVGVVVWAYAAQIKLNGVAAAVR